MKRLLSLIAIFAIYTSHLFAQETLLIKTIDNISAGSLIDNVDEITFSYDEINLTLSGLSTSVDFQIDDI